MLPRSSQCVRRIGALSVFFVATATASSLRAVHYSPLTARRATAIVTAPHAARLTPMRWSSSAVGVEQQLSDLFEMFAEANELIKDATESLNTVDFNDDFEDAEVQTKETLQLWTKIQDDLKAKNDMATLDRLVKEHEMKFKQLAAQLDAVREAAD